MPVAELKGRMSSLLPLEPISLHYSKRRVACYICRQKSGCKFGFFWSQRLINAWGCLCKFNNRPWLHKNWWWIGLGREQRDEMWRQSQVEWIPFLVTPEGKKRKEMRSDKWTCFCCLILWTALDFIFDFPLPQKDDFIEKLFNEI